MSNKRNYIIITESSVGALSRSINGLIDEYKPLGGIAFTTRHFDKHSSLTVAQAMVRRKTVALTNEMQRCKTGTET